MMQMYTHVDADEVLIKIETFTKTLISKSGHHARTLILLCHGKHFIYALNWFRSLILS